MKHARILGSCLLSLLLLCGTLAAWDLDGKMLEWNISDFRPYDIETTPDGLIWLTYYEPAENVGQLMELHCLSGGRSVHVYSEPAQFQKLAVDHDGKLWITDILDKIVCFDPETEEFMGYPLDPAVFNLPAEPFGVTVAADGSIWFTCWADRCLGRFDPATETFERFAPSPPGVLPSVPVDIHFNWNGDVLFTLKAPGPAGIATYEPDIDLFHTHTDPAFTSPFGMDRQGSKFWFVDHHANLLARFNTDNNGMDTFPIPAELTDSHCLVVDHQGKIWLTAYGSSSIGVFDPVTEMFEHRFLEDSDAHPMGIAMHDSGLICWAETYYAEHGGVGLFFVDAVTALFSPSTQVTNGNFYVSDEELGCISTEPVNEIYNDMVGIPTLNAADIVRNPNGPYHLILSPREDRLLYAPHSGYVYVKKNDLVKYGVYGYKIIFRGDDFNVPGIDAVAMMDDGRIIFSPDGPFYYQGYPGPPLYLDDEDTAIYDPDTDELRAFTYGAFWGITSLDAVELYGSVLYFSVKDPVFINGVPNPFYLEDGDVAGIDFLTSEFELKAKGGDLHIHDMDALCMYAYELKFAHAGTGVIGGGVKRK